RSASRALASSCRRSKCGAYQRQTRSNSAGQPALFPRTSCKVSTKPGQSSVQAAGGRERRKASIGGTRSPTPSQTRPAGARANSGQELGNTKPRNLITQVLRPTQEREDILDMRRFEELQAAVLYERNIASGQFDLERAAVVRGAEQHRLLFQRNSSFTMLQHTLGDVARLVRLVAH